MNEQKFKGIMAKAQQLMLDPSWNNQVEYGAKMNKNGGVDMMGNGDIALLEQQVFGGNSSKPTQNVQQKQRINEGGNLNYDKLPEFMRDSFKQMPPIEGDIGIVDPLSKIAENLNLNKQQINENIVPKNNISYSNNGGGIDYSLIKAIIDESVKNNIAKLKKQMLNESVGINAFHIGKGNKIQFLDSKGNIYEGVLKLKAKKQ